jgi:hypothetical protein
MSAPDFERVEKLLELLLTEKSVFSSQEAIDEVRDFIAHGEYGIALDWIVDTAIEDKRAVPDEWLPIVCELTQAMKLDSDSYQSRLKNRIRE